MKLQSMPGKLTKRFLFSLREGVILVSNVMDATGQPIFAKTVRPAAHRRAQWKAIVEAGVNNSLCHVCKDYADYLDYIIIRREIASRAATLHLAQYG